VRAEGGARGGERGGSTARLVFGLLVIALGAIFLGDNLELFDGREALRAFWPAAFVLVGLVVLLEPRRHGGSGRAWGLVWVVAGAWIFAHQRDWIEIDFWELFFPGVLLAVGATLVWRALGGGRGRRAAGEGDESEPRAFALMSGNEIRSTSAAFRGADLGAFMGGVNLDLTGAKLAGDEAEIDVFAMWGGIEIRVPREWTVVGKVMPLMAAFEDKTQPEPAATKRLVVRGVVVMGGVEVKN